jgi:hypothetical protein
MEFTPKVNVNLLNLACFDFEELRIAKCVSTRLGALVGDESFVALGEKFLNLERPHVLAHGPASLKVFRPADIVIQRAAEGKIPCKQGLQSFLILGFIGSEVGSDDSFGFHDVGFNAI